MFLSAESDKIKWLPRYDNLTTEGGQGFTIQESGYYYLNLQVTLKTTVCPCNQTRQSECMVTLTCHSCLRDLLEGWINPQTCSTGLLGKVEKLSQGNTLEITKIPKNIDESEPLTHLDIIMLQTQDLRWCSVSSAGNLGNSHSSKHNTSHSSGL